MAGFNISKIMARLDRIPEAFANKEAKAGWFPSAKYEDGTQVAYVAVIQENGAPEVGVPARPFIRPTVEKNKDRWSRLMQSGVRSVGAGNSTADDVFEAVGGDVAGAIQKQIVAGGVAPLSPVTLMIRKMKDENKGRGDWKMGRGKLAEAAARVEAGEAGSSRTDTLRDTGLLVASVTHAVGEPE